MFDTSLATRDGLKAEPYFSCHSKSLFRLSARDPIEGGSETTQEGLDVWASFRRR
jgi:hypothetical protein